MYLIIDLFTSVCSHLKNCNKAIVQVLPEGVLGLVNLCASWICVSAVVPLADTVCSWALTWGVAAPT